MDKIPSALERALERVEKLGKASKEELNQAEYIEQGQRLAAQYLKGELSLLTEMNRYEGEARRWIGKGAQEVLIRNIALPTTDLIKSQNKAAMEGVKLLKRDKGGVENVFSKIRQLFGHYAQQGEAQRKEAFQSLKREMGAKIRQALQQQGLAASSIPNIEAHPQFQMEWRRLLGQLDSQYLLLLKEYKEELAAVP